MRYAALALLVAGTVVAADERPLTPELRKASLAAWKSAYKVQLGLYDSEIAELEALKLNPATKGEYAARIQTVKAARKKLVADPLTIANVVTAPQDPIFGVLPHHTGVVISTNATETVVKIGSKESGESVVRTYHFRPPLKGAVAGKSITSRGLHWVVLRDETKIVVTPIEE